MTGALDVECLVIGGGPAGAAAAREAARYGAEVIVIDEGRGLAEEVPGTVTVLTSSTAWGAFAGGIVGVVTPAEAIDFAPRVTIVATGAEERLLPFPGWELPAVVTPADAFRVVRATDARFRWIVAGIGGDGATVASGLRALGQDVVEYADAAEIVVARAHGRERLEGVDVGPPGGGAITRLHADYLCVAYARFPAAELATLAGCDMTFAAQRGGYVPVLHDGVRTSVDGVMVAGAAAGLCSAATAEIEGRLAGRAAVDHLGVIPDGVESVGELLAAASASRARDADTLAPWIAAMWALEADYVSRSLGDGETALCRCEMTPSAAVRDAIADGALRPGDVKRVTRAGMGECQGRNCRFLIARALLLADAQGIAADSPLTWRPPVRPMPIARLLAEGS